MPTNLKVLQNLDRLQKIVTDAGVPTDYFIRFIQDRGGALTDLDAIITALQTDLAALGVRVDFLDDVQIVAGDYLSGGGVLGTDPVITLDHNTSGVTPGTYGDSTHVPQIDVDEFGHITDVTEVAISGGGGGGGGLYDISMGVPLLSALTSVGSTYATYTENAGKGINVKITSSVGANSTLLGWTKAKPSTTFHVAALALQQVGRDNYYRSAMGMYNSVNGRFETLELCTEPGSQGTAELATWSAYNARTGTAAVNCPYSFGPVWYHMKYDGTNLKYGYSLDGANPNWAYTRAVATYMGVPTDIFIGMFAFTSAGVTDQNVTWLCYDEAGDSRVMGV